MLLSNLSDELHHAFQVEAAEKLNSCLHAKLLGATKQMMDIMQDIAAWEAKFTAINSENERLTQEAAVLAAVSFQPILHLFALMLSPVTHA